MNIDTQELAVIGIDLASARANASLALTHLASVRQHPQIGEIVPLRLLGLAEYHFQEAQRHLDAARANKALPPANESPVLSDPIEVASVPEVLSVPEKSAI